MWGWTAGKRENPEETLSNIVLTTTHLTHTDNIINF
jgi:hypothetical protein